MSALLVGRAGAASTMRSRVSGVCSHRIGSTSDSSIELHCRAQVRIPLQLHQHMACQRQFRSATTNSSAAEHDAKRLSHHRRPGVTQSHETTSQSEVRTSPPSAIAQHGSSSLASPHVDRSTSGNEMISGCASLEQMLKSDLLRLCDLIIQQSRRASDTPSYIEVQEMLQHAVELYLKLVRRSGARSDDIAGLAYETYLIRSTLAHTVRTIGALAGAQAAPACAQMVLTYLQCEAQLRQLRFETNDGTRRLIQESIASSHEETDRMEMLDRQRNAWLLASGPFLHDMSLVFFDIFFDLAGWHARHEGVAKTQILLVSDLWAVIRQFPQHTWSRPLSSEWLRTRKSFPPYVSMDAANAIAFCFTQYFKALVSIHHFDTAIDVWQAEVLLADDTMRSHLVRMMEIVTNALRATRRDLMARKITSEPKAYCLGILRLAQVMHGEGKLGVHVTKMAAWEGMKTDSIVRCILKAKDMITLGIVHEQGDILHIVQANNALRHWLDACLDSKDGEQRWPRGLSVASCNMILEALVSQASFFGEASTIQAFRFLRAMTSTHTSLPAPNEKSITTLIAHSTRMRDREAVWASLAAAYTMAWKRAEQQRHVEPTLFRNACDADGKPFAVARHTPIHAKALFAVLQDAKERSDGPRMLAVLKAIRARSDRGLRELPVVGWLNAAQIVFLLYPSLNERRRKRMNRLHSLAERLEARHAEGFARADAPKKDGEARRLQEETVATSINDESSLVAEGQDGPSGVFKRMMRAVNRLAQVQFDPPMMMFVMSIVVKQGKTGLAERVWRLMLRVRVRRDHMRYNVPLLPVSKHIKFGFSIRIAEFIMLMYCREVRRGTNYSLGRTSSFDQRRRRFDRVVGWGSAGVGYRNRSRNSTTTTSATVARGELKENRALMARNMAIERYLEVRQIWQSMGILTNATTTATTMAATTGAPRNALKSPSMYPREKFFGLVLRVFRRRAFLMGEIDVRRHFHATFIHMVVADMRAFEMEIPDDLQDFVVY